MLVTRDIRRIDAVLAVGGLDVAVQVTRRHRRARVGHAARQRRPHGGTAAHAAAQRPGRLVVISPSPRRSPCGAAATRSPAAASNQSTFAIDGTSMTDGVGENVDRAARQLHRVLQGSENRSGQQQRRVRRASARSPSSPSRARTGSRASSSTTTRARSSARQPVLRRAVRGCHAFSGPGRRWSGHHPRVYDGHSKTFWFVSGETVAGSSTSQDLNPTVPIEAWRRGDFSALGRAIRNPLTGEVYADGRIPTAALNATALAIQQRFYPLPNTGSATTLVAQNYRETVATNARNRTTPRLVSITTSARTIASSGASRSTRRPIRCGKATCRRSGCAISGVMNKACDVLVHADLRHVDRERAARRPRLQQQSDRRAAERARRHSVAGPHRPRSGAADGQRHPQDRVPGNGLQGLTQVDWRNPGFLNRSNQIQDQITWLRGTHSVKAGTDIRRVDWEELNAIANLFGNLDFNGRPRRFRAWPRAVTRTPISCSACPTRPRARSRQCRHCAADGPTTSSSRTTGRSGADLTLNLGLRYDIHPGWYEQNNRLAMFDVASGKIAVRDGGLDKMSPLIPPGYVDIVSASSLGLPSKTIVNTDRNNFSPRIGFAYRPFGGASTVVRGGYGLYFDMMPIDLQASASPFVFQETTFTNPAVPTVVLPAVFPAAGTSGPATIALPRAVNPDLQLPVQPSVERHGRARAVEHGLPRLLRRHPRPRDVVHARHQRAGAGRTALRREAAPVSAISGHRLRRQRGDARLPRRDRRDRAEILERSVFPAGVHRGRDLGTDSGAPSRIPSISQRERGGDLTTPAHRFTSAGCTSCRSARAEVAGARAHARRSGARRLAGVTGQLPAERRIPDPDDLRARSDRHALHNDRDTARPSRFAPTRCAIRISAIRRSSAGSTSTRMAPRRSAGSAPRSAARSPGRG